WTPDDFDIVSTHADADGRFVLAGTRDGDFYDVRWWFSRVQERLGAESVPSGARGVEVRLERWGVLPRLVDVRDGRRVYGRVVFRESDRESVPMYERDEGYSAPAGTAVSIHATAKGYSDVFLRHVVRSEPGLEVLDVRMRPSDRPRARVSLACV